MRFKTFTFNLLSVMVGFHYGRNPVSGDRFLHVAPVPFFGLDFHWPEPEQAVRPVRVLEPKLLEKAMCDMSVADLRKIIDMAEALVAERVGAWR